MSDTITAIATDTDKVVGTALLRPDAARGLPGATPVSVTVSPDGKTLFAPLADMNAIVVVDAATLTTRGLLPAGWYPTDVACLDEHGKSLLVLNGKGNTARHPNPTYQMWAKPGPAPSKDNYVLNLLRGTAQRIAVPTGEALREATAAVLRQNHVDRTAVAGDPASARLASIGLKAGKIKHVIYVIKENRTYDQVLGDDARGNGDPSLVLFGKDVTPNQHAIADRFTLLDNCYSCGDVSGDGWVWGTQGIANDYVQRNLPYQYSGRGRTFDYEGENAGYPTGGLPAAGPDGEPLTSDPRFRNGAPAIPDVAAASTHLWDLARGAGLSVRNYGFFLSAVPSDDDPVKSARRKKSDPVTGMPDNYPTVAGLRPGGRDGAGVSDVDFRRFDLDYADSDAPAYYAARDHDPNFLYARRTYGRHDATSRFAEWDREFQQMFARDLGGSAVPALMLLRLPHDHTQGVASDKHTPRSEVADNDYGVGQLVGAVSRSPIWASTAIFIIEDDAQAGPDHVDCHRTTGYVISPWMERSTVDHRFYNTDSFLKSIELILGLPPMSQYDAIARPVGGWTKTPANAEPFEPVMPTAEIIRDRTSRRAGRESTVDDLYPALRNGRAASRPSTAPGGSPEGSAHGDADPVAASDAMDFDHADAAPAEALNEIIWQSVRGRGSSMPPPRNVLASPVAAPPADDD